MNRISRTIAISTAVLGLAILITTGVAGRNRIREGWYTWRLEKGDRQEQMVAAEKLGEIRSARTVFELVAAFRRNAKKAAAYPLEELPLRRDFLPERVYIVNNAGYVDVGGHGDLWSQLLRVLIEVGKPATMDLLRAAADEDDVAVAMCMVGALLEIHGYPTIGAHPWSRSRPTIQGELVLRQVRDDLSHSRDTRLLASGVLKKWFSD